MKDTGLVAMTEFLRHPSMVGSAFPATARMVRHILAPIDWVRVRRVIEYGPGSGRFTFAMLKRMRPDARLLAIETGAEFVDKLRAASTEPRLIVVHGPAEDASEHLIENSLGYADVILSGLPFSTLKLEDAETIMRMTGAALATSGMFAAYQMRTAIRPLIKCQLAEVRQRYEWWNIPPCISIGHASHGGGRLQRSGGRISNGIGAGERRDEILVRPVLRSPSPPWLVPVGKVT